MQQSAWSPTGGPAPPPPLTSHLDKVIFLNRQRAGSHKSVTAQLLGVGAALHLGEMALLLDVDAAASGYRVTGSKVWGCYEQNHSDGKGN